MLGVRIKRIDIIGYLLLIADFTGASVG